MERRIWTREELILAFNLYLKLPFGKMHHRTKEIVELAALINRTPNSVAMRLSNFATVDPYHKNRGIKGLAGGIKQVEPIWNEFFNNKEELLFESEKILAEIENKTIETKFSDILLGVNQIKGEDKLREVKTRVNQNAFRQIVLVNYTSKCAISDVDIPELLVASHIIPWSMNENERLNPENGICLNSLFDKAFDKGLIGIKNNYEIILSGEIKKNVEKNYYKEFFQPLIGKKLNMPSKYFPKKEFLEYHMDSIFKG